MPTPRPFTWSWPHIDPASIDPATVTITRDPCGRWYVSFAVDVPAVARHDRDINAAKNILAAGLAVTACGADIRHTGFPRMQPAMKQEPRPARTGIPVH
jgi:transposase